jgi:hypothetical protein
MDAEADCEGKIVSDDGGENNVEVYPVPNCPPPFQPQHTSLRDSDALNTPQVEYTLA